MLQARHAVSLRERHLPRPVHPDCAPRSIFAVEVAEDGVDSFARDPPLCRCRLDQQKHGQARAEWCENNSSPVTTTHHFTLLRFPSPYSGSLVTALTSALGRMQTPL